MAARGPVQISGINLNTLAQNERDAKHGSSPGIRDSTRGFFPSSHIGDRSHGGTGLLSAATYSVAPVRRTAATTEVVEYPSDWGDGVELPSPNLSGITFCHNTMSQLYE